MALWPENDFHNLDSSVLAPFRTPLPLQLPSLQSHQHDTQDDDGDNANCSFSSMSLNINEKRLSRDNQLKDDPTPRIEGSSDTILHGGRSPSSAGDNNNMFELLPLKNTATDRQLEARIRDASLHPLHRHDDRSIADLGILSPPVQEPRPSKSTRQSQIKTEKRPSITTPIEVAELERIRAVVQAFLCQRPSIHEYTVPRLFIVLPDDMPEKSSDRDSDSTGRRDPFKGPVRYRLYFLCECSNSFTLPLGSGLNHLHIAKHGGYGIDPSRQEEFFNRFGQMILTLLIFLKHGHHPEESLAPQNEELPDMVLKRVDKLSSLKKADLPDSIVPHLDQRVNKMLNFLERFRETPELQNFLGGEKSDTQTSKKRRSNSLGLHGLSTLADLHHLYSFLGIANASVRYQSGQLGNLYRIGNARGQVSWVCVYHYRWTFLEKNIDEFERWIVTRRGFFDKQTGSVSISLVSRQHARTFCSWVSNKVAPSLVEIHVKLGWKYGKNDLKRLAETLADSTVTVLTLDGCSTEDDSTYKIFHKKYDPILHLLAQGQIQSLTLLHLPSFFTRLSPKVVHAPSLRRLELGFGMTVDRTDQRSFISFLASCSSLQELSLPGLSVSDLQMTAVLAGVKKNENLTTLDISSSCLDDGAAIILAQGLFNTGVCHLDLSKNEQLSDAGAARVIRAIGPKLTSLKMAQTGFGDQAAAALAKSMDGISIKHTLRDQLQLQHRLDVAALTAGHRPGLRVRVGDVPLTYPESSYSREQTHTVGHLVYLDIEDNQCTAEGFRSLASIKSRFYLLYLNLAGSCDLGDEDCGLIMEKMASSAMVTLRLSCTGFGNASALALAHAIKTNPPGTRATDGRSSVHCRLEELDLQGCPIGSEGFVALQEAFSEVQAFSSLKILDLGHCGSLQGDMSVQLLKTFLIPNGVERLSDVPSMNQSRRSSAILRSVSAAGVTRNRSIVDGLEPGRWAHYRSDSTPVVSSTRKDEVELHELREPLVDFPPTTVLPLVGGFFTNMRQLDLKSTNIGDNSAWLLSQALIQPWILLESLTVLEPALMTSQGLTWIIDALRENTTVTEFGIGKSGFQHSSDLDLFGSGLVNLMEVNKHLRILTTLGAPLGAIAKGLLLNHGLHSMYLIRSKGQLEDLQMMGQALGFNRTLLVFWMGGSDDSLFGSTMRSDMTTASAFKNRQQQSQHTAAENTFRNFHMQLQEQLQEGGNNQGRSFYKKMGSALRAGLGSLSSNNSSSRFTSSRQSSRRHARTFMTQVTPTKARQSRTNSNSGGGSGHGGSRSKHSHTAGGVLSATSWTRNPLIDGIRRNHSLIKVTLDTTPPSGPSTAAIGAASRASTWSSNTNTTAKVQDAGRGGGHAQDQIQLFQHELVQKKIMANRKLLRERGRVGVDELRLLGVDDDVIREVCHAQ
ncbi:hypothetical protein EMPS_02784 [Entomortierella parvispora]|uniref:Uncharacterized protein n=1 Tax=Entomortierella parvispora TaxID=205924 RepID=A0A9P3LU97_9FUNG|nr:hypothetical protein EMPS_02784 [Entomortierella parvispora]